MHGGMKRGDMSVRHLAQYAIEQRRVSPPLAVVVVTYNSASVLPGLLDSLLKGLEGVEHPRIIVVDNDSRDASVELALDHPLKPEVIRTGRNAGYAAGINEAAKTLPAEADLLVLNPDIRLFPGTGRLLQDCLQQGAGIVVPQILHPNGTIALSLRREPSIVTAWSESLLGGRVSALIGTGETIADELLYRRGGKVEWATGAALMIAAHARQRVGPWDESFFLYSEEVDYMRRTRECGFSIEYACDAKVIHIGGEAASNPFLSGLLTTNRIRDYGRRHGPAKTLLFRLGVSIGAAFRAPLDPASRASLKAALTAPGS